MSSPISPSRWLRPFRRERDPSTLELDDSTHSSPLPRPILGLKTRSHSSQRQHREIPIFGSDIVASTALAHGTVLISTDSASPELDSQPVVYGNIPLVIVSCGSFLKRNALATEGIFRVAGSSKRIKQLQQLFSTGPDYGANIDWTGYTVHDAASLLRRYLTALPEPLIPLRLYNSFRTAILERPHLMAYLKEKEQRMHNDDTTNSDQKPPKRTLNKEEKKLILDERKSLLNYYASLFDEIEPIQRRTLFYIFDLLALFHLNSKQNRMSAKNLSYVFQPSIISHPADDLSPDEYVISGFVLEFCITYSYKILSRVQEQTVERRKLHILQENQLEESKQSEASDHEQQQQQQKLVINSIPDFSSSNFPSRPHSKSLSNMDGRKPYVCEPPKILTLPQPHRELSFSTMGSIDMGLSESREADNNSHDSLLFTITS